MYIRKIKKNPLLKKLNGYLKWNRDIFFVLHIQELTQEEFILYLFGLSITDWDVSPSHRETYGSFSATNRDIADAMGLKSDSTISRTKKSLIKKEFFVVRDDGRIVVKDFERWLLRKPHAERQN